MTKKSILTIITEFSDIQNMIDFFQSLIVFQNTKKISPTNEDSTSKRLQKRRNSISIPQTHEVTIKKNIQKINSLTSDSNIKNDTYYKIHSPRVINIQSKLSASNIEIRN